MKKLTALFLAIVLALCFVACSENPENLSSNTEISVENKNTLNTITLLYSEADGFNPYTVSTDTNRQLCKLLYEPLVKLDNEFQPVFSLAQSVEIDGKECVVTLKNARFSDGSYLTADDVVYSCNLALKSSTSYAAKLYEVKKVVAADSKTVVFTLTKSDPYFVNLLDFPIIKSGSDEVTDSDNVYQPPVGCGRFMVAGDKVSLVINPYVHSGEGSINSVKLINAPDGESIAHYIEVGAADIYYNDFSDDDTVRMSGDKYDINLNNLVYIGINSQNEALALVELRQALCSAIDRDSICQTVYYNNAISATGFYNPVWNDVKSVQNIQTVTKSEITIENLEKIGYNKLDKDGKRVNSKGRSLSFTLLVNSENTDRVRLANLIKEQLWVYGIKVTVLERKYETYLSMLEEGDFQLYLGEVKITENMDFTEIISPDGAVAYGIEKEEKNSSKEEQEEQSSVSAKPYKVLEAFYKGETTITDVAQALQNEMPLIPLCYRTGALFCNDNIENVNNSSASDIYFSIESYIYNKQ